MKRSLEPSLLHLLSLLLCSIVPVAKVLLSKLNHITILRFMNSLQILQGKVFDYKDDYTRCVSIQHAILHCKPGQPSPVFILRPFNTGYSELVMTNQPSAFCLLLFKTNDKTKYAANRKLDGKTENGLVCSVLVAFIIVMSLYTYLKRRMILSESEADSNHNTNPSN